MKYDSNKGTFVSIGDGSNTTAGTKAVTAKSLKLSALGTQYTTNNADGTTQKSNFKDINVEFFHFHQCRPWRKVNTESRKRNFCWKRNR